jgi:hypothetical protein
MRELRTSVATQTWEYQSSNYAKVNPDLLQGSEGRNELIFCGGSGGFSITQEACEQQIKEFHHFCNALTATDRKPEYFTCISSLGAMVSAHRSHYKTLIEEKEKKLRSTFQNNHTVIRLPSLYGYNRVSRRAKGLIAMLTENTVNNKMSSIYGRLDTSRNYLSAEFCCSAIAKVAMLKPIYAQKATIDLMATKNYTIRELCSELTRACQQVPIIRLLDGKAIDCESHFPRTADGVKLELFEDVHGWICKRLLSNCHESRL